MSHEYNKLASSSNENETRRVTVQDEEVDNNEEDRVDEIAMADPESLEADTKIQEAFKDLSEAMQSGREKTMEEEVKF
ncbi:hypothetical protein ACE6H2_015597 [Prunus campanulata]